PMTISFWATAVETVPTTPVTPTRAANAPMRNCRMSVLLSLLLRDGGLDVLADHVRIGGVPLRHLLELAALDLPDLHETAALVVGRRDLEGRHQPPEGEVGDLLEA